MDYLKVTFNFKPYEEYVADLLNDELAKIDYESFEFSKEGLNTYIQAAKFNEESLNKLFENFSFANKITYTVNELESKNWNEEWEKNYFEPIIIHDECVIHSSFHHDIPKLKYDIVIDPKMSFGTGHHETTSLMLNEILKIDSFGNKRVLDMGCGTAVLAILAAMKGSTDLVAIDIDNWCVSNSKENIELNHVSGIDVKLGDASLLVDTYFDVILANINRNILLNDMKRYADVLKPNGEIFMSGFYVTDISVLEKEMNKNKLSIKYFKEKNNWAVIAAQKSAE